MSIRKSLAGTAILILISSSLIAQQSSKPIAEAPTLPEIINWIDYARGVQMAKAANKPMLVYFYRDSCPYCRKLKAGALTDSSLAVYLNSNFVPIRINTESQKMVTLDSIRLTESQLANENWMIRGVPAMWLLEPDGCRIKKMVGLQACGDVLSSLKQVVEHTYGDCPNLPLAKPRPAAKADTTTKTN